jgi:hypothetical protein
MKRIVNKIFTFYYDGFRNMTTGRGLWVIIIVKLVIMFLILKLFFFPDFLKTRFKSDQERSNYILHELTKSK